MAFTKYAKFLKNAPRTAAYWTRVAMRDFTEDLLARMSAKKMNQAALAEAANVSPAYITKVLRGSENFTLETMAKLAMAVGGKVRIHIADQSACTYWIDSISGIAPQSKPATQALSLFELPATESMKVLHFVHATAAQQTNRTSTN
ncbi:MAG: helix-turn-helix domain-containing protein [Terriglobia bacterium]